MSHSLNESKLLKGGYIGDYYRGYEGGYCLDYGSYRDIGILSGLYRVIAPLQ